jgi:hypothetical protein
MSNKARLLLAIALSLELTFLGAVTAFKYVTKDNSFGFDICVMALGGALAATLAGWKSNEPGG